MAMMETTLAAGLPLLGLDLPEDTQKTLCAFARAMVKQNEVMNLTAITEEDQVAKLHLLDMKGGAVREELDVWAGAIRKLGLKREQVRQFPVDGASHAVIILRKVSPTPSQYPRRYTKIKQSPL